MRYGSSRKILRERVALVILIEVSLDEENQVVLMSLLKRELLIGKTVNQEIVAEEEECLVESKWLLCVFLKKNYLCWKKIHKCIKEVYSSNHIKNLQFSACCLWYDRLSKVFLTRFLMFWGKNTLFYIPLNYGYIYFCFVVWMKLFVLNTFLFVLIFFSGVECKILKIDKIPSSLNYCLSASSEI